MMNGYLGRTARAFDRNFYNPHGQSSMLLFTRRKAMFFPPIGVKRVGLEGRSSLSDDDGHVGRRRELSGAAMANLDDFGKAALALTL
jgi:hypothetical protein